LEFPALDVKTNMIVKEGMQVRVKSEKILRRLINKSSYLYKNNLSDSNRFVPSLETFINYGNQIVKIHYIEYCSMCSSLNLCMVMDLKN
jgi:TRAP-type mannitol/chloroaromatic compound transport system substrate-binding protein